MLKTTSTDRLLFTILFSLIIHLVIVLGVSFDVVSKPSNAPVNNIEITLVKHQDNKLPEKADYLAQVDNEGGGLLETPSPEPTPDLPVPIAEDSPSASPPATTQAVANKDVNPQKPVIEPTPAPQHTPSPVEPAETEKPILEKPSPQQKQADNEVKKLTQKKAVRKVTQQTIPDKAKTAPAKPTPKPKLSARDLIMQAQSEISELQARLDQSTKALSERPKKRRISASTKEFAAAAYMKSWELKVERIGNMNYPEEARRKNVSGSLMLSVDINPDGSVPEGGIVISRSSGYKVLDDAAVKIVRLGAPYAVIPDDVLQGNDMLTIIRTWKFETGRGLSTR